MLELVLEYRDEAQFYAGLAICFAALRWGAIPERCVALVWIVVFQLSDRLYHFIFDVGLRLHQLDVGHATIDLTAAIILVWLALQANRMYTLWIAAFQLVSLASHLARAVSDSIAPLAYAMLNIGPSYFQLCLLLGGLIYHLRRKRVWGEYRDWRLSTNSLHSS